MKLTSAVTRTVVDVDGNPLVVTLTAEGILFRRPRRRDSYLLPFKVGETRAQTLAAGVGEASQRRRISRGLLTTN